MIWCNDERGKICGKFGKYSVAVPDGKKRNMEHGDNPLQNVPARVTSLDDGLLVTKIACGGRTIKLHAITNKRELLTSWYVPSVFVHCWTLWHAFRKTEFAHEIIYPFINRGALHALVVQKDNYDIVIQRIYKCQKTVDGWMDALTGEGEDFRCNMSISFLIISLRLEQINIR